MVPFPNKEEKLWGRETTKWNFFCIIIFPVPPTKSNFKQSKCILDMVSACLPPQVSKARKVLGNNKRRKFRMRGCCSSGAIKLEEKQERKQFFIYNLSLGKIEPFFKKVLIGKVPNHFCPSFCSWLSLLESFRCLLFSLSRSRLFLAEKGFHKSDPSCPYVLVYFCITCLPQESGLTIHLQTAPHYPWPPLVHL